MIRQNGGKWDRGGETGQPGSNGEMRSWSGMMILAVIMRQGRTALKDMKAIMVMRMTAIPEALIIKIHAVDDDDTADGLGRNEGYSVFLWASSGYKRRLQKHFNEPASHGLLPSCP